MLHVTFSQTVAFSLKMRPLCWRRAHKSSLVLSLALVLCNLVCFRWCAGDDSCSSPVAWAKESSKRWAQLDAEVATGGIKVSLPCRGVCMCLCGEDGLGQEECNGLSKRLTVLSFRSVFLLCLFKHWICSFPTCTRRASTQSCVVDPEVALLCHREMKDENW